MWRFARTIVGASALLGALLGALFAGLAGAQEPRWSTFADPGLESSFDLFVPSAAVLEGGAGVGAGATAVIFLHDAGRPPDTYRSSLTDAADALGLVLILPRATSALGWGFEGDLELIERSLAQSRAVVPIEMAKVAIAGHGDGAAYAYLLAYVTERRFSSVLALGAPYLPVSDLFDPEHPVPILMLYGGEDMLYSSAGGRLREQWSNLGVDWRLDVLPGFGHSTWTQESLLEGFRFLAERSAAQTTGRCSTGRTALCLNDGRFRAEVTYAEPGQRPRRAQTIQETTSDSGILWFFDSDNWEVMVKVLDGCALNGHVWVYAAATTDVGYRLTVTDQSTGRMVQYEHEPGSPSPAFTDTAAFAACALAG
jgi:hypothetical protein